MILTINEESIDPLGSFLKYPAVMLELEVGIMPVDSKERRTNTICYSSLCQNYEHLCG